MSGVRKSAPDRYAIFRSILNFSNASALAMKLAERGGPHPPSLEPRGDAIAQGVFGGNAGDVKAAADDAVDQRANHAGTGEHGTARPMNVADQAIQPDDLAVHEHDGHFGPRLTMNQRSPAARATGTSVRRSFGDHVQL